MTILQFILDRVLTARYTVGFAIALAISFLTFTGQLSADNAIRIIEAFGGMWN